MVQQEPPLPPPLIHGADGVPEVLILLLQKRRELETYPAILTLNVHILLHLQNRRKGRLRFLDKESQGHATVYY